jgi:16S rRNA (guanine1207-N2)-methyltransferase
LTERPAGSGETASGGKAAQYFAARPTAAHRPGLVRVVLPDLYLELETDSGMFSPGRLDPGTRFLLESGLTPPSAGDLLDVGCGYGPIACALAARAPGATVWAIDVNERALGLCAANAARAGLANVRAVPPDAPELPAVFAGIWSNPPIRIGKPALHDLLRRWLARLAPGAEATLVVGRNLGADSLHGWLEQGEGWSVRRLAARSGYRLLRVTAPDDLERTGASRDGS